MGLFYLAGPMSGYEDFNYPAFMEAADALAKQGHEVLNPADMDPEDHTPGEWPWERYVTRDLHRMVGTHEEVGLDGVVVLPGWEESRGARLEVHVAVELGLPVLRYPDLWFEDVSSVGAEPEAVKGTPEKTDVSGGPLETKDGWTPPWLEAVEVRPDSEPDAAESVLEEAQRLVYGDRQADYGHPYDDYSKVAKLWSVILDADVDPHKAALCMVAVKISREVNRPKRDNRVDMAGYAAVADRIVERMDV